MLFFLKFIAFILLYAYLNFFRCTIILMNGNCLFRLFFISKTNKLCCNDTEITDEGT